MNGSATPDRIAELIDELRAHGMSIAQIALKVGVVAQTVYRWWRGVQKIRARKFFELLALLPPERPVVVAAGAGDLSEANPQPAPACCSFCMRSSECSRDLKKLHRKSACSRFLLKPAATPAPVLSEFELMLKVSRSHTTSDHIEFRRWYQEITEDERKRFDRFRADSPALARARANVEGGHS